MAGATTLGDLASAIGARSEEAAVVAELKAGSEEAYAWLIGEFQKPVYGLVYRIVADPSDAADTTQEVFLKVFRGMKHFHGESSLKTWIYRIALHEAANRKRWWFRHKAQETSIEPAESDGLSGGDGTMQSALADQHESPFDSVAHREVQQRVGEELRKVPEPYRTTLILRDLENGLRRDRGSSGNFVGNGEVEIDPRAAGIERASGAVCARGWRRAGADGFGIRGRRA